MFIDSHCHLDRIDLTPDQNDVSGFMKEAKNSQIDQMLCIAIDLESYPAMVDLVKDYPEISLSVGVHPNVTEGKEPSVEELIELGSNPKVIAIGETGLDFPSSGPTISLLPVSAPPTAIKAAALMDCSRANLSISS